MATIKSTVNAKFTQMDSDGSLIKKHLETNTNQVLLSEAIGRTDEGESLTTLLTDLQALAETGGVTGIKLGTDTTVSKGEVTITKSKLGLGNVNNVAITSAQVTQIGTNATNITSLQSAVSTAQSKADSAYNLASGRKKAVAYDTKSAMIKALKAMSVGTLVVGDNIYIKETGVPDYWVSAVLANNSGETGWYEITPLEVEKVDLSSYATLGYVNQQNSSLSTSIAGVRSSATTNANDIATNKTNIATNTSNISSLSTKVANLESGTTAANKATKLATARTISSTGDVTWSVSFTGAANVSSAASLSTTGVSAGTYSAVTVDAKGRVTAGAKSIVVASSTSDSALNDLAVGGIAIITG